MSNLPSDAQSRKGIPLFRGLLKYFPDALCAVAECSMAGNKQHHANKPLHWDKSKSTDEGDALMRHLVDAGTIDNDGIRHSAKVAWRALALLQREIDAENAENSVCHAQAVPLSRFSHAESEDQRIESLLCKENNGFRLTIEEQRELMAAGK